MATFTSARERRLWLGALATLVLIYSTLGVARTLVETLRSGNLLRLSVAAVMLMAAVVIAWRVSRAGPGTREVAVLATCGLVYLVALVAMERAEEKLHLLQYGLVAALVLWALDERRARGAFGGRAWLWAILATAAAGWLDEGIQAILPSRVYDLRDVAFNAGAGVLAVGSIRARDWARRLDRDGSDEAPPISRGSP